MTFCDLNRKPLDGDPRDRIAVLAELAEEGTRSVDVQRQTRQLVAGLSRPRERAQACLAFVQSLRYRVDPPGTDDGANACAVLIQRVGDCKKKAILLGSMLALAGLEAVLVWKEQPGAPLDHVTVKVRLGGRWRWAESTVRGAQLGEDPYEAAERLRALREGWL